MFGSASVKNKAGVLILIYKNLTCEMVKLKVSGGGSFAPLLNFGPVP